MEVRTMAKRKSKINRTLRRKTSSAELKTQVKEVLGFVLLFFGIFIYLTVYFPGSTGLLGYWCIEYIAKSLVGSSIRYLPYFLGMGALAFFMSHKEKTMPALWGIGSSFLAFVMYLEIYRNGAPMSIQFPIHTNGGGLIGVFGSYILHKAIGPYGSQIFLITVGVVATVLVFNFSVKGCLLLIVTISKKIGTVIISGISMFTDQPTKGGSFLKKVMLSLFFTKKKEVYYPDTALKLKREKTIPRPRKVAPKIIEPEEDAVSEETPPVNATSDMTIIPKVPQVLEDPALQNYVLPAASLLDSPPKKTSTKKRHKESQENAASLEEALSNFNVDASVVNICPGPSVTRYELQPSPGTKISKITNLAQDIALNLAASSVRIEAPIPGKALVGIEVPNPTVDMVNIRSILAKKVEKQGVGILDCAMGLTITGDPIVMPLEKMPHVLIAGATGSGKSVCVNGIIISILLNARPDEVKFLMIDPKKVELNLYEGIPHLLAPVVTNPQLAAATLKQWALIEMERRYEEFAAVGVKDIIGYNAYVAEYKEKNPDAYKQAPEPEVVEPDPDVVHGEPKPKGPPPPPQKLPYIVVIIDELADLMMVAAQDVENTICRLAQMARATGIHLVIATQRPSVNVVTGLIKANVPSRISFYVQSQIDSRTILDMAGAEKLLGRGDMLYMPAGSLSPKRVQGVFVSEKEVKKVVGFVKKQGKPNYLNDILTVEPTAEQESSSSGDPDKDELYDKAKEMIQNTKYASTSYLQRKLRIGYNRAARLIDELEEGGVISAYDPDTKKRTVLQ
ncbi:cell division protein FtsK [Candidatus Marinamargulisbacteria bacterium SCGC AG-439-L15]|nr:cell division protein FtsK [Candidatus Marinamargulisbacteria bacterium SCGC AG-439-L15]